MRFKINNLQSPSVAPLMLMLFAAHAHSASEGFSNLSWSNIGWGTEDWMATLIVPILILLGIMAGYLVFAHFRDKKKESVTRKERSRNRFEQAIEEYHLNEFEVGRIKSMLQCDPAAEPQVVFESLPLYEKCIQTHFDAVLKNPDRTILDDEELVLSGIRRKIGYHFIPLEVPLASTRNIVTGQMGSMFTIGNPDPVLNRAVVTRVTELCFTITFDPEQEDTPKVSPGQRVRFAWTRSDDGLYGVTVTVLGFTRNNGINLSHTIELKRNQMRQFVRVETDLPVKIRLIKTDKSETSEVAIGTVLPGKMVDLSGGGLCFSTNQQLKPGDMISLNFSIGADVFAGIPAKIIRVSLVQKEEKSAPLFRHHVQYLEIAQSKRERIVKYVFEKKRVLNQWR